MPSKTRAAKPVDLTLEREVQRDVVELYERLGCVVVRTAQSFRRGGRRNPGTPGIPDLLVFLPCINTIPVPGFAGMRLMRSLFWHETKTLSGKQKPTQAAFQRLCVERGVTYVLGGEAEAIAYLQSIGLIAQPGRV